MKRRNLKFVMMLAIFPLCLAVTAQDNGLVRTVVIDAGHGGKDPGALGKHSKEKDLALSIALKTGAYIEQYLPDVKVIYTRKTDKLIPLHERAKIANENHADLFISIHCNANRSSRIYGTETYVMGLHKNAANLEVAKLENASILQEENYEEEYEGFDPNSDLAYIIFNLYQNEYLTQSLDFASRVQDQFRERVGLKDRSVMQAGFLVLYRTTMPSVLVETGYLTHAKDEQFLRSKDGQVYIASAIYRAFKEYKMEKEKNYKSAPKKESEARQLDGQAEKEGSKPVYRVQFTTHPAELSIDSEKFSGLNDVFMYQHGGLFKYTAGRYSDFDQANTYKNELRSRGYKDAFVVVFLNDRRIALSEAKKLSGN